MTPPSHSHADPWTAFGVGVLGGVIGGLSLLSFAGIFAVALIAILGGVAVHPRPFGAAGVLIGWAVTWVLVLGAAQARCDPASCVGPDLAPWVAVSAVLALIGAALLLVGIRQPTWAADAGGKVGSLRSIRIASAVVLGVVAGMFASSLLIAGWATAIPIGLWFAWKRRDPGQRTEIAWFAFAAVATFAVLVPR